MLIILILPSTSLHEGNKMFLFCLFWHTFAFHTRKSPFYRWIFKGFICNIRVSQLAVEMHLFQGEWRFQLANAMLHAYAANGFSPGVLVCIFPNSIFWDVTLQTGSCNIHSNFCLILGSWSNEDGNVKENGKRGNRFKVAKQQPNTCITPFSTFLCRHSATTMWKCLISRFVEDMNARQRSSFSFCELRYSPLELNSWKNRQHMTN